MSFIPDKMVDTSWRDEEREIEVSDEFKGKSGDEIVDEIREKNTIKLD
ncbi:MAG: hypothetical protein ABEK16_02455 [Candidatus Nanohalobium sp.]